MYVVQLAKELNLSHLEEAHESSNSLTHLLGLNGMPPYLMRSCRESEALCSGQKQCL